MSASKRISRAIAFLSFAVPFGSTPRAMTTGRGRTTLGSVCRGLIWLYGVCLLPLSSAAPVWAQTAPAGKTATAGADSKKSAAASTPAANAKPAAKSQPETKSKTDAASKPAVEAKSSAKRDTKPTSPDLPAAANSKAKAATSPPNGPPAKSAGKPTTKPAAEAAPSDSSAADKAVMERFFSVLEKNPRRGTAFDKVYGYYVERGELPKFAESLTARTKDQPQDGVAWMILGLVESQRGQDTAAIAAFTQAETLLPTNAMPSYYLGLSLQLAGRVDDAIAALERAVERKPSSVDLMDVFQALGRAEQRALRPEKALAVWERLEKMFPGDTRVQEQIATSLVEENQFEAALPRLEKLAGQGKDKYKQSRFKVQVAEIKVRLGRKDEGLKELELLLTQLNPDNWLYRDVRKKIEEVFLRSDDQDGLTKYYDTWIKAHPQDVDAMVRMAKVLDGQARGPETLIWLQKAIKLAPTRKDLRRSLIEHLVAEAKIPEALKEYEELAKQDPNNPDLLRDWGRLILKETSRPEAERKTAAAEIWERLAKARPEDPLAATQVADLLRQAEMNEPALEYYKKAVTLAPDTPQYREYLGEFYHQLKRTDEALATWKEMAAGPRRTAKSVARLAEVLNSFGFVEPALVEMAAAVQLDPKDFNLRLQAAELYLRNEKFDLAQQQLLAAQPAASSDEEREAVLQREIRALQGLNQLQTRSEQLSKELAAGQRPTADRWLTLARYQESLNQSQPAYEAVQAALKVEPQSISGLKSLARLQEARGELAAAADTQRKLADLDRRYRTEYLTAVAKLEARLGRREAALQAGRDVIAAAPGSPEHYESFASLCFQLGANDEGLDALRRLVRANPAEPEYLQTLAKALTNQFRADEAMELYWQAFDRTPQLDDRLTIVTSLAELAIQKGQFDRLVERLQRMRREAQESRDSTICLAQAYIASGDPSKAREELEQLVTPDTRDTQLLQQLTTLAESEGDLSAAIRFQLQLVRAAPSRDSEVRLLQLYQKNGETEEAANVLQRLSKDQDLATALKGIDAMLSTERRQSCLPLLERLLRDDPDNWELLYREALAYMPEQNAQAEARLRKLLSLKTPEDEPSVMTQVRRNRANARPRSSGQAVTPQDPLADRLQNMYEILMATGISPRNYGQRTTTYAPTEFRMARIAAYAWLISLSRQQSKQDEFVAQTRAALRSPGADLQSLWDDYFLSALLEDHKELFVSAERLARQDPTHGGVVYLTSLASRDGEERGASSESGETPTLTPLTDAQLQLAVQSFEQQIREQPHRFTQNSSWLGAQMLAAVVAELDRAKNVDLLDEITKLVEARSATREGLQMALQLQMQRKQIPQVLQSLKQFAQMLLADTQTGQQPLQYYSSPTYSMGPLLAHLSEQNDYPQLLQLLEESLQFEQALAENQRRKNPRGQRNNNPYGAGNPIYLQLSMGKGSAQSTVQIHMTFPLPDENVSYVSLQLLKNTQMLYEQADLTSDLIRHFEERRAAADDSNRVARQLHLAYLLWWSEQQERARELILELAPYAAQSPDLQNIIIRLHEEQQLFDEALALIDAIPAKDQTEVQTKEQRVLSLALRCGDRERAIQSAERLFGMRLSSADQSAMIPQLRSLGRNDLADAMLARMQRVSGQRPADLVVLMQLYQSQNQGELAGQIALQLLRTTKPRALDRVNQNSMNQQDQYRQEALGTLKRIGRLQELISKAEKQLETAPQSIALLETLASYYEADEQREKVTQIFQKIRALRPDDANLNHALASKLYDMGDHKAAADLYLTALKKDLRVLQHDSWKLQNSINEAEKGQELADILEKADLRMFSGNYWMVFNLISNLMNASRSDRDKEFAQSPAMKLFRSAWKAFPQHRQQLLGYVYREELFALPEAYDWLRETMLPQPQTTVSDPWYGLSESGGISMSSGGRIETVWNRLIRGAAQQKRLPELLTEIEAAQKRNPQWKGGTVFRAWVLLEQDQREAASAAIRQVIDDKSKSFPPMYACWALAQAFRQKKADTPLQQLLLEKTLQNPDSTQQQYQYSPAPLLVAIYKSEKKPELARKLLLKQSRLPAANYYDQSYQSYLIMDRGRTIGKELIELDYPLDGLKMIYGLMQQQASLQSGMRYFGSTPGQYLKTLETLMTQAETRLAKLPPAEQLRAALELAAPDRESSMGDDKGTRTPRRSPQSNSGRLDLMLVVGLSRIDQGRIHSVLLDAFEKSAQKPETVAELLTILKAQQQQSAEDFSLAIALVCLSRQSSNPADFTEAIARLRSLVQAHPLEEIGAGQRPNSRQRSDAARQIPLWLAARSCRAVPEDKAAAIEFEQRALAAAGRQFDVMWKEAMLKESSEIAFAAGDLPAAEQKLTELLDTLTESARKQTSRASRGSTGGQKPGAPNKGAPAVPQPAASQPATSSTGFNGWRSIAAVTPVDGDQLSMRADTTAVIEAHRLAVTTLPAMSPRWLPGLACLLLLADPASAATDVRPQPAAVVAQVPAPASAAKKSAPATGTTPAEKTTGNGPEVSGYYPLTATQFKKVIDLSRQATRQKLDDLSLKALQRAFAGGSPVPDPPPVENSQSMRRVAISSGDGNEENKSSTDGLVEEQLTALRLEWIKAKWPSPRVYQALKSIVLPAEQPDQIRIYLQPLTGELPNQPRSVGWLLVNTAVEAKHADDLRQELDRRAEKQESLQLTRAVLLYQLAFRAEDVTAQLEQLKRIDELLAKKSTRADAELACHAILPALRKKQLKTVAQSALLKIAERIRQTGQEGDGLNRSIQLLATRGQLATGTPEQTQLAMQGLLKLLSNSRGGDSDYRIDQLRRELTRLIKEVAVTGRTADALPLLAQFVDLAPVGRNNSFQLIANSALHLLLEQLASEPAAEQYRLLAEWSLPAKDRRYFRVLGTHVQPESLPNVFLAARRDPSTISEEAAATSESPAKLPSETVSVTAAAKDDKPQAADAKKSDGGERKAGPALKPVRHLTSQPDFEPVDSTWLRLIDAAVAAGQLDALRDKLKAQMTEKIDDADFLWALTELRTGQKTAIAATLDEITTRFAAQIKGTNASPQGNPWPKHLLLREMLARPDLKPQADRFAEAVWNYAERYRDNRLMRAVRQDVALGELKFAGAEPVTVGADPDLALWIPASETTVDRVDGGAPRGWWIEQAGHLCHITGTERDYLISRYPLTGEFEFSIDANLGHWGESNLGYGGLVAEMLNGGGEVAIFPVGRHETVMMPDVLDRSHQFNRLTIQVAPGRIRFLNNNQLCFEERQPSGTSPFLMIEDWGEWKGVLRKARLSGQPVIPREVQLIQGNRLDGWVSNFYAGRTQPARLMARYPRKPAPARNSDPDGEVLLVDPEAEEEFDEERELPTPPDDTQRAWYALEGGLQSGTVANQPADAAVPSRLTYLRPLQDREQISYQFHYIPGQTVVHPALDRLVFLLTPEGLRLHWMLTGGAFDTTRLDPRHAVVPDLGLRVTGPLPLKPNAENDLTLRLEAGQVILKLNEVVLLERPLEPENSRQFSFFHFADQTSVRVKDVRLSGDWPESLTPVDLAAPLRRQVGQDSPALSKAKQAIVTDAILSRGGFELIQEVASLPPLERYRRLKQWVMPNAEHANIRLTCDLSPLNPPSPIAETLTGRPVNPALGKRQVIGGELISPAWEMVVAAKAANQLLDLAQSLQAAPVSTPVEQRSQMAIAVMIAIVTEDDVQGLAGLERFRMNAKTLSEQELLANRWCEAVVARKAVERPLLARVAQETLDRLVSRLAQQWSEYEYLRVLRALRSQATLLRSEAAVADREQKKSPTLWEPVSHVRAQTRGSGWPQGYWKFGPGQAEHFPGHAEDYLYFGIPLAGDFEIQCQVASFDFRESTILYGAQWSVLRYDRKSLEFGRLDGSSNLTIPEVPPVHRQYQFRAVIKDNQITYFANDRQVHQTPLTPDRDPWLALHCASHSNGHFRDLRILGSPTIPKEIDLLNDPKLNSWRPSYLGEAYQQPGSGWGTKQNDQLELIGQKIAVEGNVSDGPQTVRQRLLRYHRPLLEDGEIEYEFFYRPGRIEVHPALDRMVLLLQPDGVQLHWLTDTPWDRSPLRVDNRQPAAAPATIPLQANDWNRMRVRVEGDLLKLELNGQPILQREIDPLNQRFFGLYHDATTTAARVRKVRYRGQWPTALPSVAEQQLAVNAQTLADWNAPRAKEERVIDFRQANPKDPLFKYSGGLQPELVKQQPNGWLVSVPPGDQRGFRQGVEPKLEFLGDFDMRLEYSGLKVTTTEKDKTRGLGMIVRLQNPQDDNLALFRNMDANPQYMVSPGSRFGDNDWHYQGLGHATHAENSGILRVHRTGANVRYLVSEAGGKNWRLLEEMVLGPEKAYMIELVMDTWDKATVVEVVLERLTMKAEKIQPK